MPEHHTTRKVAHSAEAMFNLVADVERYPEFVPFCETLNVRGRRADGQREVLVADMTVGYRMLRETFTSKVTLDRPALSIRADYLDGPFRALENVWEFKPQGESASEISFRIVYEFRNRALALLMGAMFDRVFRTFAGAFETRADKVYGKTAITPGKAPA